MKSKNRPLIRFSHNWNNKLEQSIFTTIRKFGVRKASYYSKLVGEEFDVELQKVKFGKAKLIDMQVIEFGNVPRGLLYTDTGMKTKPDVMNLFAKFKVFPSDNVIILTFDSRWCKA